MGRLERCLPGMHLRSLQGCPALTRFCSMRNSAACVQPPVSALPPASTVSALVTSLGAGEGGGEEQKGVGGLRLGERRSAAEACGAA